MDRRTAISRVAILLGGAIIGGDLFISGCTNGTGINAQTILNDAQVSFLNEVAEGILPETAASGGAKAANVGEFMRTMVRDCYSVDESDIFFKGLDKLEESCKKMNGKDFLACSPQERQKLLVSLDSEVKEKKKKEDILLQKEKENLKSGKVGEKKAAPKKTQPVHYFAMIKQLSLLGYFTSEIGYKALGYVPVPGYYNGDVKKNSA